MPNKNLDQLNIAVIGLGYVGLPLALALSNHFKVSGYDIDLSRIAELKDGNDRNNETPDGVLASTACAFTDSLDDVSDSAVYIVTVPTPITKDNEPDLTYLEVSSKALAPLLKDGDIIVYESTVYPGVTEDVCGPILERGSGLKCGQDIFLGYSPERINPGDTKHTVETITKVVAGQTPEVTDLLEDIYGKVNGGNIFKAADIKTAETSKVIENAQRDINVAFINEVTKIVNELDLSVYDVLEAAGTKWNFLPFTPGLVGGHCIGVDPYYLAQCAEKLGHNPEVVLAGRHTNDGMGAFFASRLMGRLGEGKKKTLILGFTFKENINDIRNTKVIDIHAALSAGGYDCDIHDPQADPETVKKAYGVDILSSLSSDAAYDALILAVPHDSYKQMGAAELKGLLKDGGLVYDLKGLWRKEDFTSSMNYLTV